MHGARKRSRRQTIEVSTCSGSTVGDDRDCETGRLATPERQRPQRRGAFRGYAAGDQLVETAEYDIRQKTTNDVPAGDRLRTLGIEDASLRRRYLEGRERARIVRDIGCDGTGERVGCVSGRVVEGHIDPEARGRRRATPVDHNAVFKNA